jgi:hypothetical protein
MGVLCAQLGPEQRLLLQESFTVYDRQGLWPVWFYLDHVLDEKGLAAEEVLASLPVAGGRGAGEMSYGLTWHKDGTWRPNDTTPLHLTVAGMWHMGSAAAPLLAACMDTLRYLVKAQRSITPSPAEVVEARVSSQAIAGLLGGAGLRGPALEIFVRKVGQILEHEPYLWHRFMRPHPDDDSWELRVPVLIREFREVTSVQEYIETVERLAEPSAPPAQPLSAAPLDIPYAVGFADAVWESRTGFPLFARPDPASIARLTQPCDSEGTFNSLMSALADVLSQVAKPGTSKAPRQGALEEVRQYLNRELDQAAAARCSAAIETLIKLRTVRHSIEHGDARPKAVDTYADLGLSFPVASWPHTWTVICALTCGALDVLREEAHVGLGS